MAVSAPDRLHFTGNDEADELLAREPLALLIGFALDQQVPLGEQTDEHALEHLILPRDDAPDLEERALEALADLGRLELPRFHCASLSSLVPEVCPLDACKVP